ncbi:MAG TPA: hypothetical protein VFZ64_14700 [Nocardioidaceae bacterium]
MGIVKKLGVVLAALALVLVASPAHAGSPHFIKSAFVVTVDGDTLTVSGKEAGLGSETQVHIELVAEASCINGGGKNPKAVNKDSFSADGDFPVQNGKADFTLSVTATFQPSCSPPMTVEWTKITVTDTEHDVSASLRL